MTLLVLILACAPPNVAPQTLAAIIHVESGGDPLALHVNDGRRHAMLHPLDVAAAVAMARQAMGQGHSVDIGLMQVNSANVARFGVTIEQMFAPCLNIRAGARILAADYGGALQVAPSGQAALKAALSAYNTGDFRRGFANGYVARFYGAHSGAGAAPANPYTADTEVFHRSDAHDGTQGGDIAALKTEGPHTDEQPASP